MQERTVRVRTGKDFGLALAEARAAKGLTQREVAESSGIDRTYLARLESGQSVIQLERALLVLRRLGAEVIVSIPADPAGASSRAE